MIKKFNEDWHSHLDTDNSTSSTGNGNEFVVDARYSFLDAIQRAKKMALEQDRVIPTNFKSDGIILYIDKYSDPIKLQKEFLDKKDEILKSKNEIKFKLGDEVIYKNNQGETFKGTIIEDHGEYYEIKLESGAWMRVKDKQNLKLNKSSSPPPKFKVGDIVRDLLFDRNAKIIDYDNSRKEAYRIEFDNGAKVWTGDESLKPVPIEVKFERGIEVIGLPSGQVIYMDQIQLQYFKARDAVKWVKVYKKPVSGGGRIPMQINAYCFEDPMYSRIIDMMDTISW